MGTRRGAATEKEAEYEKKNLRVENALYKAAVGYKVKVVKPVKVKEETNRPGEGKQVTERVVTVREEKYVEPKITAQMFWLKSRMPALWGQGDRVLGEVEAEMRPILETYADVLEDTMPGRELEDGEEDSLCPADG